MDKPFLSFDEQIEKLKNDYKLIINNHEFAKEALTSLSYYDLVNGYQFIYMEDGEYKEGTTIEHLYSTHTFNKNIQGVLIKYATYVEGSFKNLLAHVVAESFTEHQDNYLSIENYSRGRDRDKRAKLQRILSKLEETCIKCADTPTKHYRESKNHIPPWVLFRNTTFSVTTDLFSFLKKKDKIILFEKVQLLNSNTLDYSDKVNIMLTSLNLTRKFRNKIAHNLDFLTYRKSNLNKKANTLFIDTLVQKNEIEMTRNDVWAMVIAIVILLNNRYLVYNFLAEFQSFMENDRDIAKIYCMVSGIPLDFEYRIKKYIESFPLQ